MWSKITWNYCPCGVNIRNYCPLAITKNRKNMWYNESFVSLEKYFVKSVQYVFTVCFHEIFDKFREINLFSVSQFWNYGNLLSHWTFLEIIIHFSTLCAQIMEIYSNCTLFWQKFRECNIFTKEITKYLAIEKESNF